MAFWQENYGFIKDVYDWRHQKMVEWMELVERVCFIYYWIVLDICHIYVNYLRLLDELWQTKSIHQRSSKGKETTSRYVQLIYCEGCEYSEADTCQDWPQNIILA